MNSRTVNSYGTRKQSFCFLSTYWGLEACKESSVSNGHTRDGGIGEALGRKPVYDVARNGLQLHIRCLFFSLGFLIASTTCPHLRGLYSGKMEERQGEKGQNNKTRHENQSFGFSS